MQACWATNRRCSLLRWRFGVLMVSTLLSIRAGSCATALPVFPTGSAAGLGTAPAVVSAAAVVWGRSGRDGSAASESEKADCFRANAVSSNLASDLACNAHEGEQGIT